jgi:hypothetical protein
MKLLKCFLVVLIIAFVSCKKGEVPGNMTQYVGTWKGESGDFDEYQLVIKEDGTAEYLETKLGSYKTISGYIYFEGYNFKIGTYRINKKFTANEPPKRVTTSVKPYKYYYAGEFNGISYVKE